MIIWTEAALAVAAADSLSQANYGGAYLFGDRVAVPSFGKGLASALAAPVGDGVLSAGSFAGPDMPTAAADAFFLAKERAVSTGAVTTDLGVADFRSHDAVLALVKAAENGGDRAAVADAIKRVSGDERDRHGRRTPRLLRTNSPSATTTWLCSRTRTSMTAAVAIRPMPPPAATGWPCPAASLPPRPSRASTTHTEANDGY